MPRYALYFAPERDTRVWHFGNRVLGRDAETGESVPQIVPDGMPPDDWQSFTASPRRYGFHATLKAPFALAPGKSEADLLAAVRGFAARHKPIAGLNAAPVLYGDYAALMFPEPDLRVQAFAAACVTEFDGFRAPLTQEDSARREAAGLNARQKDHLERWGYPYVFEDFVFHMTLAGPLPPERGEEVLAALKAAHAMAVKDEALAIRSLAVFAEPEPKAPFTLILRAPLGAG